MGAPVTISTEEYKKLLEAQIRLDMILRLINETESNYSVDKEDLCRALGIKYIRKED